MKTINLHAAKTHPDLVNGEESPARRARREDIAQQFDAAGSERGIDMGDVDQSGNWPARNGRRLDLRCHPPFRCGVDGFSGAPGFKSGHRLFAHRRPLLHFDAQEN
jgi:hypothetical protein